MTNIRKGLAALLLVASLAFPAGAFAATQSGQVNEDGTAAASISATIPTTATYTYATGTFSASIPITAINSQFSGGLTVSVMPNASGANRFNPANRAIVATGPGFVATPAAATPGYWTGETSKVVATRATDATSSTLTFASTVNGIVAAGSYTGDIVVAIATVN